MTSDDEYIISKSVKYIQIIKVWILTNNNYHNTSCYINKMVRKLLKREINKLEVTEKY